MPAGRETKLVTQAGKVCNCQGIPSLWALSMGNSQYCSAVLFISFPGLALAGYLGQKLARGALGRMLHISVLQSGDLWVSFELQEI